MDRIKGKILVVDDEENVRNLVQLLLQNVGYEVDTASDGEEALSKVERLNIDVVILDIKMPGMSGVEILQYLTVYWPDICVIMVTAVDDASSAIEAVKLGAYDYVTKPFDKVDLIQRVQKAIEKRNLKQETRRHQKELEEKVYTQSKKLREYFSELVETLAREHNLLFNPSVKKSKNDKLQMSKLPPELQKPMSSVEEYKDALLRLLKRTD